MNVTAENKKPEDDGMNFTEAQSTALSLSKTNVLVSASAGSGKTRVMVKRIVRLIEQGKSLKNMVVCTFTNASAADMREQITSALIKKSKNGNHFATQQLKLLPSAQIGTIDSWCQKIVKSYFYLIGVASDFDVIDSNESKALACEIIGRLIDQRLKNGDKDFLEAYDSMLSNRDDTKFRDEVYNAMEFASTQVQPEKWLDDAISSYDDKLALEIIEGDIARRSKLLEEKINQLMIEARAVKYDALAVNCSNLISRLKGNNVNIRLSQDDSFDQLNSRRKKLLNSVNNFLKDAARERDLPSCQTVLPMARGFIGVCKDALRLFTEEKIKKNKLSYNDIEHLAYKIIMHEQAGGKIRRENQFVFVDEYQDVNPLQDAILSNIAGGETYLVGDVKQSIYAFRMGDPSVFIDKYENHQSYGFAKPVEFRENFRSKKEILDYCNKVFERAMTPEFGSVNYKDVELKSGSGLTGGKVEVKLFYQPKADKLNESAVYSVEKDADSVTPANEEHVADYVMQKISSIVGKEDVAFKNKDGVMETRKARYDDVAVLFRVANSSSLMPIYRRLKKQGIDVFFKKKIEYAQEDEIKPLISFLTVLSDGRDEVALTAFLLSPFGKLTETELYIAVKRGEGKGFIQKIKSYANSDTEAGRKISRALEVIEKYRALAPALTVCELLGQLISETQYFNYLLRCDAGEIGAAILSQYLDFLSGLKIANTVGEYLDFAKNSTQQFELEAPEGSLKMMTVHSSKGLQFPYVFLVDCDKQFNERDVKEQVIIHKDMGIALCKNGESDGRIENKIHYATKIKKQKALREECLRLLYVALTRAIDGLFITANVDQLDIKHKDAPSAQSFFDFLLPVSQPEISYYKKICEDNKQKGGDALVGGEATLEAKLSPQQKQKAIELLSRTVEKSRQKVESSRLKASVTGIAGEAEISACNSADEEHEDDRADKATQEMLSDDKAREIMELGTAYHKIMELIDFSKQFDSEAERLSHLFTDKINVHNVKNTFEGVKRFLLQNPGDVYKEQSFVYKLADGTLVQGVIDLMVVNDEGVTLLDYKLTGEKNLVKEQYERQLNLYAEAVEEILRLPVTGLYLCSITGNCIKSVPKSRISVNLSN